MKSLSVPGYKTTGNNGMTGQAVKLPVPVKHTSGTSKMAIPAMKKK
jgi:hypothetical protein